MLSSTIPGYPAEAPQSSGDLLDSSYKELKELDLPEAQFEMVTAIRREFIDALHTSSEMQVSSIVALKQAITQGYVTVPRGRWLSLILDEHRRKVRVTRPDGSIKASALISRHAPSLANLPAIPENGRVLIIWGGSPSVLEFDDARERLNEIRNSVAIADIVFSNNEEIFSSREGFGETVDTQLRVEFPNPEHLRDVFARTLEVAA